MNRFISILSLFLTLAAALSAQERVFVMASSSQEVEWSPLKTYSAIEAQLYTALYEGLLTYHPATLKPVAGVADSWEISDDRTTYTFHIRDDASFSDGTPIDSRTFRDSWLALLSPANQAPFAGLLDPIKGAADFRNGKSKSAAGIGIKADDPRVLVVELSQPTAHFIQVVCHQSLVPIHPAAFKRSTWRAGPELIGNGPFRITSSTEKRIEFEPNPRYWDKANLGFDRLVVLMDDDEARLTRDYNAKEINWIESGAQYDAISDTDDFQISPQFSTTFLFFSTALPAFRDPRVRSGLIELLPLEDIRSKDFFLVPSAQLVPGIPGYPKAKSLEKRSLSEGLKKLEQAGFPKGKGLPPLVVELPQSDTWTKIGDLIKAGWKDLECPITIRYLDSQNYTDQDPKRFVISSISWIGDYADPMTFLDLWQGSSSLNRSGYSDAAYDGLLAESNSQQGAARYRTLSQAEEILLQGAAAIPLNHSPAFNVIDLNRIGGWFDNPLNIHPFKYFQFKPMRPPRNVAGL